jgi:Ca-activated chloride channel family protein
MDSPMTFIWPSMLLLLVLVPVLVLFYLGLQRRRRRIVERSGSLGFLQGGQGERPGFRKHLPPILFIVGLAIMILALARPNAEVTLPKIEGTVILAFDVSGSMAADDMQPTRMEAAKAAARDFVERQPSSVQIGVVAFSDGGIAVQPPTNDQDAILASIERLSPQLGTSLGNGILASLNVLEGNSADTTDTSEDATPMPTPTPVPSGTYAPAAIVLITDGENTTSPDPLAAAQEAANRGVRIYTIGIGSAAGTTLHINGYVVHTQLDEGALQQLSMFTDGEYFNAQSEQDLKTIYDKLDTQLVVKPEKMEVTSIFAGASLFMLLVGGVFSLLWFGRLP